MTANQVSRWPSGIATEAVVLVALPALQNRSLKADLEELLPPCDHPVHPSFDRMPGGFPRHFTRLDHSVQRRSVTVDGRPALLNTGTSRIDLEWVPRTPGWLP
jgi:hypothetical protein